MIHRAINREKKPNSDQSNQGIQNPMLNTQTALSSFPETDANTFQII